MGRIGRAGWAFAALVAGGCSGAYTTRVNVTYNVRVPLDSERARQCVLDCQEERLTSVEEQVRCLRACPGASVGGGECRARDRPPDVECVASHQMVERRMYSHEPAIVGIGAFAVGALRGGVVGANMGRGRRSEPSTP